MLTISGLGFDFSSITSAVRSGASSVYDAAKTGIDAAKSTVCRVTTSPYGQVGINAVASAYGVPPQSSGTATQMYNQIACGQGAQAPGATPPIFGPGGSSVFGKTGIPSMFAKIQAAISTQPARIARFNTTRRVWSVYRRGLSGIGVSGAELLGGACIFGDCAGLGAEPDPAPPDGYVKEQEAAAKPADAVDAGMEQDRPFYKKWQTYAIAGGALAVLGGGYYLMKGGRRRRRR